MTVNNQILERMMTATAASSQNVSALAQGENTEGPSEFESMIRQRASQTDDAQQKQTNEAPTADSKQTDEQPPADEDLRKEQELAAALVTAQPVTPVELAQQPLKTEEVTAQANLQSVPTVTDAAALQSQTVSANVPVQTAESAQTGTAQTEPAYALQSGAEISDDYASAQFKTQTQPQAVATAQQSSDAQQAASTVVQVQPQNTEQGGEDKADDGSTPGQTAKSDTVSAKTETTETPLFESVDAIPVKVAQPSSDTSTQPALDLTQTDATQKLAEQVDTAISSGSSKLEIKLSPENLGDMTVEITRASDGSLGIVLKTTTDRAASILEQSSSNLQNLLAASTQSQVKIEVQAQTPQQSLNQFLNPDDSNGRGEQQNQQQQQSHEKEQTQDFVAQLRLGLIELNQPA